MAGQLRNVLIFIAGRNAKSIGNSLQSNLGQDIVQIIELPKLREKTGEEYLEQKQKLLHIEFASDLRQKLLLLSEGKPILIDLASEWLARNIPLDWLVTTSLAELQSLSEEQRKQRQREFERQLVVHIAQERSDLDTLILWLSRIYPMDVKMIATFLKISEQEAKKVAEEAQSYGFVKHLPDGRITLHDEMRRMINEYVWVEVDPDGDRQRRDSELITKYLENKIQIMTSQLSQLEKEEEIAADKGKAGIELDIFAKREALERETWIVKAEYLKHTLLVNTDKGVNTFANIFDEATKKYQISLRETLLVQMQQHIEKLSDEQLYELNSRRVKYLLDRAEYLKAKEFATKILENAYITTEQRIDTLTRLANCDRALGKLQEAIRHLDQALRICRDTPELKKKSEGSILNTIGWMHRLMGKWNEAGKYYRQSIELIKETGDEAKLAAAYNNLGYIIGLQSNYDSALIYSHNALSMQESLGLEHDSGRTHNTLGIIYRGKENYSLSLKHTNQAISIFEKFENKEWLAIVYCERGTTKWHIGEPQEAEPDLEKSYQIYKETDSRFELSTILHRRGHIAWDLGNLQQAEQYFQESAKIGREVSDFQQTVNSLEGLVELYYFIGERSYEKGHIREREEWYAKAEKVAKQWKEEFEDQGYYFPLYSGSRLRILGNIAYDREDYKTALQQYLEAYPRIASLGGYSKYMLPEALNRLKKRIDQLPAQLAFEWCDQLQKSWEEKGLNNSFPEMIILCEIGRDNARRRAIH
jgi:tetratricopeptide (TPR) repeat protein